AAHKIFPFPRKVEKGRIEGTYESLVKGTSYLLIYRITQDGDVEILTVFHTSRQFPDTLKDLMRIE
ncbi:type II toxin-antitoxin system RelE/ParE family toxin, partial [Magnetococcales bacterium HHB-1]